MRLLATIVSCVCAAVLLAGCGAEEETPATTAADDGADAGSVAPLIHVDGVITTKDGAFVLTPTSGGEPITFTYGPEVQVGAVKALEAAASPARVTFRPTQDAPIAAAVVAAPKLDGLETFEGTVSSVDARSLVVDGADGERSFDIAAADRAAFDVSHLRDHAANDTPIRVYFDPAAPDAGVAYEDA